ncbi:hypothetical protein ACJX0J_029000, partial [Zea mays]
SCTSKFLLERLQDWVVIFFIKNKIILYWFYVQKTRVPLKLYLVFSSFHVEIDFIYICETTTLFSCFTPIHLSTISEQQQPCFLQNNLLHLFQHNFSWMHEIALGFLKDLYKGSLATPRAIWGWSLTIL